MRKFGYILEKRTRTDTNRIEVEGDIAKIIITDGNDNYICEAIIDSEDVEKVRDYRWTTNGKYIRCFLNTKPIYLHRFLLGYEGELDVDHINRNRLDNRKANLRVCSRSINVANRESKGYRLITNRRLNKPWLISVSVGDKKFNKYVATEEEAKRLVYEKRTEFGIYPKKREDSQVL